MRKKAFILVVGIIIAAGALFTAVYDVIYRYNSSNTTNLNAATVDYTGEDYFGVAGGRCNGAETTTLNFDQGTYMVTFVGQSGESITDTGGAGAVCLAFYKGSSMTVVIGEGGGTTNVGKDNHYGIDYGARNGYGKTSVKTNFALPVGYNGELQAIASGAGGGMTTNDYDRILEEYSNPLKLMDGTFAGWDYDSWKETVEHVGTTYGNNTWLGTPGTQSRPGIKGNPHNHTSTNPERTANCGNYSDYTPAGSGGGAGYYDGGAGYWAGDPGGGGSCTPWCYPLESSDIQNGPTYTADNDRGKKGTRMRNDHPTGVVNFTKLDPNPTVMPSGGTVEYGDTVGLVEGGMGVRTPYSDVKGRVSYYQVNVLGLPEPNYDCGIRTGWVYSVSEDGKSWQGVGPDDKLSASETQASDTQ